MSKKVKPLVYPFTFEEWQKHPSTLNARKFCKQLAKTLNDHLQKKIQQKKYGQQQTLEL
jgi:hypothetical protein